MGARRPQEPACFNVGENSGGAGRCWGDVGEMLGRCWRMWGDVGGDVGEMLGEMMGLARRRQPQPPLRRACPPPSAARRACTRNKKEVRAACASLGAGRRQCTLECCHSRSRVNSGDPALPSDCRRCLSLLDLSVCLCVLGPGLCFCVNTRGGGEYSESSRVRPSTAKSVSSRALVGRHRHAFRL